MLKFCVIAALTLSILASALALKAFALLVPSEWEAVYQIDGEEAHPGITQGVLFDESYIFVQLPKHINNLRDQSGHRISFTRYLISLERQRVLIPVCAKKECLGVSYVHRDQLKGVDITGGKVDDAWTVSFSDEMMTFKNSKIVITVSRKIQ